jgi:hypothetical protein
MKRRWVIGILLAALTLAGSARLSAQNPLGHWSLSRMARQSMTWSIMSPGSRTPIWRPNNDSEFRYAMLPAQNRA